MSREIRRVPVEWQHPTEPNPYWRAQLESRLRRGEEPSRLHIPQVRFVGLTSNFARSLELWEQDTDDWRGDRPDPVDYMPTWTEAEADGWCLYETVSDGSPITPVFPTAEALIEHLCTEGDDWDHTPWRRGSAERMVSGGHSCGSFLVSGGVFLDGSRDLDLLA